MGNSLLLLLFQVNCFIKNLTKEAAPVLYGEKCQEQINKSAEPKLTNFIISSTHLHGRIYILTSLPACPLPPAGWEERFSSLSLKSSQETARTLTTWGVFQQHLRGVMLGPHLNMITVGGLFFLSSIFKSHGLYSCQTLLGKNMHCRIIFSSKGLIDPQMTSHQ